MSSCQRHRKGSSLNCGLIGSSGRKNGDCQGLLGRGLVAQGLVEGQLETWRETI